MKNKLLNQSSNQNDFITKYKNLSYVSYYGSWFMNATDIALMFFFVYPILIEMGNIESKFMKFMAFIFSSVILFIFEYVKRFLIYESFVEYLLNKLTFKFKFLLACLSLIIVSTGYMAISGTQEISFKKSEIVENIKKDTKKDVRDLELKRDSEIEDIKKEYQKSLDTYNGSWQIKYDETLRERNTKIDTIKNEYNVKITKLENQSDKDQSNKLEFGEELLVKAIVLTLFIEMFILFGVMFIAKYHVEESKIYEKEELQKELDRQNKINEVINSPEYQRYKEDLALLNSLYKSKQTSNSIYIGKYMELKSTLELNMKNFETPNKKKFDKFMLFLKQNGIITGEVNKYKFIKTIEQAKMILTNIYEFENIEEIK